jgi:hypothetical protein
MSSERRSFRSHRWRVVGMPYRQVVSYAFSCSKKTAMRCWHSRNQLVESRSVVAKDGDRPSRTNLQDALSTTMSGLAIITNAPASMITRHGFSYIQPSATSLSLVLVQEPALKLLPPNTRHLYSSQAGLQRRSSWPAHGFRSSSKCPIMDCSVFCFHRESHF